MTDFHHKKQIPDILTRETLNADPIAQFRAWLETAKLVGEIEHTAMLLATVNKNYDVSARIVLLKNVDEQGFDFFTNYTSPKAKALSEIPKASLTFWWPKCERQVRITGDVAVLEAEQSDAYFNSRSKESRIGAIASKQSQPIENKQQLMEKYQQLLAHYANEPTVPRPEFWGGFRLAPKKIEFWQAGAHRLHDRFVYQKTDSGWQISQLSP